MDLLSFLHTLVFLLSCLFSGSLCVTSTRTSKSTPSTTTTTTTTTTDGTPVVTTTVPPGNYDKGMRECHMQYLAAGENRENAFKFYECASAVECETTLENCESLKTRYLNYIKNQEIHWTDELDSDKRRNNAITICGGATRYINVVFMAVVHLMSKF
ncbi:uncharacterized protein LOC131950519 [Physella acuta]|uniref:uncharacterized protein LOC131950519 n=1 Tax=Physella acuta TaxID=109671 RepID=UPI0027DD0B4F|nr:uncharacterized protein LOC131950519 [Physella acuta]